MSMASGVSLTWIAGCAATLPGAVRHRAIISKRDINNLVKEPHLSYERRRSRRQPRANASAKRLKGHTDWINSISYSQDGKYVASGSRDRTVKIWDPAAGKDIHTHKMQPEKTKGVPGVKAVTFVGAGNRVAASTGHWDVKQK